MRSFLTSANISLLLCAIGIPTAAALIQKVYKVAHLSPADGHIYDIYAGGMADTILVLFFAVLTIGATGLIFATIGLRKKDQSSRAAIGATGNTLLLLFTFIGILYWSM